MGTLFISLLTLVLVLVSIFVIFLVLMQRTSQSGGMGAALAGGAAESAFGSDTNTVLTKATIYGIIAFFIISLGLFLIYQSKVADRTQNFDSDELIRSIDTESEELKENPSIVVDPESMESNGVEPEGIEPGAVENNVDTVADETLVDALSADVDDATNEIVTTFTEAADEAEATVEAEAESLVEELMPAADQ